MADRIKQIISKEVKEPQRGPVQGLLQPASCSCPECSVWKDKYMNSSFWTMSEVMVDLPSAPSPMKVRKHNTRFSSKSACLSNCARKMHQNLGVQTHLRARKFRVSLDLHFGAATLNSTGSPPFHRYTN